MRIVNPSYGRPNAPVIEGPRASIDWHADPIVLFSNSKPNARELLEGVRERMSAFRDTADIGFVYKDSVSQPAPTHLYDEIARDYRGALLAIGD